jgi:hypothetical protein
MVKVWVVPPQPFATGVTDTVAIDGVVPPSVAVNGVVLPTPLAPRPTVVLLLAHRNVVPLTVPVNVSAGMAVPLHTVCAEGTVTSGVGLTVMVKLCAVPIQPAAVGVTVMAALSGTMPVLTAVKAAMLPLPVAPRPTVVLLLDQL